MRRGINYDVGTHTRGSISSSRDDFDLPVIQRELEIIRNDLKCDSVRISGQEIERLVQASRYALQQGLEVWFSPAFVEASEKETLAYFKECAKAAEELRKISPSIVFVAGCELTFFMKGLVDGKTSFDRMGTFMKPWRLLRSTLVKGSYNRRLNRFLAQAVPSIRDIFHGQITYASGPWEKVAWSLFDVVGIDYYRHAGNWENYRERLREYKRPGKPVAVTEFGCCTYRGAEDKGGYGWAIVDRSVDPPRLKGQFVRDEEAQSKYLMELLQIFEEEGMADAFVFTFVSPTYPYNQDPQFDLDMASYSIVKTYSDRKGTVYPGMPWDPKKSFNALAEHNGRAGLSDGPRH